MSFNLFSVSYHAMNSNFQDLEIDSMNKVVLEIYVGPWFYLGKSIKLLFLSLNLLLLIFLRED